MHDKEVEPVLDFCTRMQIREIMTASYIFPPLTYDQKTDLWGKIPIESLMRGSDYFTKILGEYV